MAKTQKKKVSKTKTKTATKKVKKAVKKTAVKTTKKPTSKAVKKNTKTPVKKVAKKSISKPKVKTPKKTTTKNKTKINKKNDTVSTVQVLSNSISGKNFLFTGTLTSMQRKDAEQKVKELGGKILSGISNKLDYLVVGEKAGSKLKEAKKISSIKIIDENEFVKLSNTNHSNTGETLTNKKDKYRISFHIYGYGAENCISELDETQKEYWKKLYKKDEYDAEQELKDHLWNYDYDEEVAPTHFGKWYDQDNVEHAEKAYYSDSSRLVLNIYMNDNPFCVEDYEIAVTDKSIKKEFTDEFVPTKKNNKGEAYLHTYSVDKGGYCEGELTLPEGEKFELSKLSLIVGKLFDTNFVWDVCYDGEILDDEGCQDSNGKSFEAKIYFF